MRFANKLAAFGAIAAMSLAAGPAFAHHSFAMFDSAKDVTLEGTVVEFQWTNPHSWVQVQAKDSSGKQVEWSIEMASPNSLARSGWKRTSLKPGDKVTLVVHPMKDGSAGGSLVSAAVDGVKIGAPR
jgi:Family of unknown function (DUF6152)